MASMAEPDPERVDGYIVERLIGADPVQAATLAANRAAGLPAIDVSPAQGKLLMLLARMGGARRILEVGTLGGYSTIWLARALPEGGRLVTLELEAATADVARANIAAADFAGRVEVRTGPAADSLRAMIDAGEPPFDLIFIDADKQGYAEYLSLCMKLARSGAALIFDNVVRGGEVVRADSSDAKVPGTRALYDALHAHPQVDATAIQTVGAKGWDGFVLAVVR